MIVYYRKEKFMPLLSIYKICQKEKLKSDVYAPLLEIILIFFKNHSNQGDTIYFIKETIKAIEGYNPKKPEEVFRKIEKLNPSVNLIGHKNIQKEKLELLLTFVTRFDQSLQKTNNKELAQKVEEYLIQYIQKNYKVDEETIKEFVNILGEYKNEVRNSPITVAHYKSDKKKMEECIEHHLIKFTPNRFDL